MTSCCGGTSSSHIHQEFLGGFQVRQGFKKESKDAQVLVRSEHLTVQRSGAPLLLAGAGWRGPPSPGSETGARQHQPGCSSSPMPTVGLGRWAVQGKEVEGGGRGKRGQGRGLRLCHQRPRMESAGGEGGASRRGGGEPARWVLRRRSAGLQVPPTAVACVRGRSLGMGGRDFQPDNSASALVCTAPPDLAS